MKKGKRREAYAAFIDSAEWKRIRKGALVRAGFRCQRCSSEENVLHVHHRSYKRFGGRELPEDLEVLCVPCHRQQHKRVFGRDRVRKVSKKVRKQRAAQLITDDERLKKKRRKADLNRKIRTKSRLLSDPNR